MDNLRNTAGRALRTVLVSATALALVAVSQGAGADEHIAKCIQDASGLPSLNCTANDLGLGTLEVTSPDGTCRSHPGAPWTIDGILNIEPDNTKRYDLGFYIGSDGQALTGTTCWVDILEDPALDPEEDPNDTFVDLDGDACGDHDTGALQLTVHDATIKCADTDGDGYVDVPVCVSYDNNAQGDCNGEADAIPANDAKCQCFTVNTDVTMRCLTNADCSTDDNPCTDEVCHPTPGSGGDEIGCSHDPNTISCDDGLFCNGTDNCSGGSCVHAGDPCIGGNVCGNACNEGLDTCLLPAGTLCRASAGICDPQETCTGSTTTCPSDTFLPTSTVCRGSGGVCDPAEYCTGTSAACPANAFLSSATVCRADAGQCDVAENCTGLTGDCPSQVLEPNGTPCDDGLFCTVDDLCTDGSCGGSTNLCSDDIDCTVDVCDEDANTCHRTPDDSLCNDDDECTSDDCQVDANGCVHDWICQQDICRSPGYWAHHSGYEKKNSVNVGQMLLDLTGPLSVCGQSVAETSNDASPYMSGLGLESDLQGLCMRTRGVHQRQLYRQLVAAALNCAVSGHAEDCDTVVTKYVDVKFSDCSDVCAGTAEPGAPSVGKCTGQLDCFNNGGTIVDGKCAYGTCAKQPDIACGGDSGSCPLLNDLPQECVRFEANCHATPMCNEDIEFCPKTTPASSQMACKEAKFDACTIDSCP